MGLETGMNGSESLENATIHEKSSNQTTTGILQPIWIICETTSATLTLFSLYVVVVLVLHMRKQRVRRVSRRDKSHRKYIFRSKSSNVDPDNSQQIVNTTESRLNTPEDNPTPKVLYIEQMSVESNKSNSNLIHTTAHSTSMDLQEYPTNAVSIQRRKERDRGAWLLRTILACVVIVTLRSAVEQCLLLMGDLEDPVCDYLTKAMVATTAISLHCCHVFLWLRQLTFYSNPVLKPLRSKTLKAVSYAAYAIMPVTLSVVLALFMLWRDYESVDGVCMPTTVNLATHIPFGVLVASTVTIQVLLSSLFLYPLLMHRKKQMVHSTKKCRSQKESVTSTGSLSTTGTAKRKRKRDKLMECIKRVFRGATVGITTDVVGGILSIFIPTEIPMFAFSVLYNLNVWLNVFCLIYTYANWRQMLFPWCCAPNMPRRLHDSKAFRRASTRSMTRETSFRRRIARPARPKSSYY